MTAQTKTEEVWPRVVPLTEFAVNVAPTAESVTPKSAKHKALEVELVAAEKQLNAAMQLIYEQERAALAKDQNGPMVTEYTTFVAPANEDRIEAEANLSLI